jgi:hypothetical protein
MKNKNSDLRHTGRKSIDILPNTGEMIVCPS